MLSAVLPLGAFRVGCLAVVQPCGLSDGDEGATLAARLVALQTERALGPV